MKRDEMTGRHVAGFAIIAVLIAIVSSTGCGGSDYVDDLASNPDGNAPGDGSLSDGTTDGGSNDGTLQDGSSNDGSLSDGTLADGTFGDGSGGDGSSGDGSSGDGSSGDGSLADSGPPICATVGNACTSPTDCCTFSCINNLCANKQCISDNAACATGAECCGGACNGNVCTPLNPTCKTAGNACTSSGECCGKFCSGGFCSNAVTFCTQKGDVCSANSQCCGGNCTIPGGAQLGTCGDTVSAPGTTGCDVKGTICSTADAGSPACGGSCCSRVCAPTGTAGGSNAFICEPPSGCQPTGELCRNDSDCCGWSGAPAPVNGPVQCSKSVSTQEFGRCNNGTACREPGSICKPSTASCNAENDCCESAGFPSSYCNANPDNCCRQDALGIPRCLLTSNITCNPATPIPAGTACATSADCCGNPCVNNQCLAACVPTAGQCTTDADCCAGIRCVLPTGSSKGVCGGTIITDGGVVPLPDSGPVDSGTQPDGAPADAGPPVCAFYGQSCATLGCCDGVPCTGGVCRYP
jgi:hypothetical protein